MKPIICERQSCLVVSFEPFGDNLSLRGVLHLLMTGRVQGNSEGHFLNENI